MPTPHEIRRSLGNWLAITRNRLGGRTYAPHPRRAIFVETSARCNLACRFCAYEKTGPGTLMATAFFADTLGQIADMGFDFVWLTPMLGEAFADPALFDKLALLEREPRIRGYGFYSNFILPDAGQIAALSRLAKFHGLHISLYGFDAASFTLTARKPAKQFERLFENLEALFEATADWRPAGGINFHFRTVEDGTPAMDHRTPFIALVRRFRDQRGARVSESGEYDNWAGAIAAADVAPLGIELTDGRHIYMHGACTKVFGEVQIKADGTVHACACRDTDRSLVIGDLGVNPLARILSWDNPAYRRLIEEQMRGKFGANCRSCSAYRSVYDHRPSRRDGRIEAMDFDDAVAILKSGRP